MPRPKEKIMRWPDRIRGILKTRNWTQADLAERLRVSRRAIEHWLSGKGEPLGPAQIILEQFESGVPLEPEAEPAEAK